MAKALYSRLFHWIVAHINEYLQPQDRKETIGIGKRIRNYMVEYTCTFTGILDIFGFENFQTNSFEQLCINLANEQLQQYFNTQIFTMEKVYYNACTCNELLCGISWQEEYSKEGLEGLDIKYQDNQPVLQLFLSRPIGVFSLLDEQCRSNVCEIHSYYCLLNTFIRAVKQLYYNAIEIVFLLSLSISLTKEMHLFSLLNTMLVM